ncbi:MAG: corrinoid protein [Anaerolineales bacterium]|nr:corrinoid protein [Anaerolineales bacterium]
MNGILKEIFDAVLALNKDETEDKVKKALVEKVDPAEILKSGLIAAMSEVGDRFESGDLYVPEMLVAARAMQAGLALLKPLLTEEDVQSLGTVVVGTVKGDLHDIGKNLVAMMLEGAGYEIIDLGTDVSPSQFAEAVREHSPDVVGMSALLTTTMPEMANTIEALEDLGVRESVKVIIGGAPVTQEHATNIGADGFAADASRAVKLVRQLQS